jgi:hypothetical protein
MEFLLQAAVSFMSDLGHKLFRAWPHLYVPLQHPQYQGVRTGVLFTTLCFILEERASLMDVLSPNSELVSKKTRSTSLEFVCIFLKAKMASSRN